MRNTQLRWLLQDTICALVCLFFDQVTARPRDTLAALSDFICRNEERLITGALFETRVRVGVRPEDWPEHRLPQSIVSDSVPLVRCTSIQQSTFESGARATHERVVTQSLFYLVDYILRIKKKKVDKTYFVTKTLIGCFSMLPTTFHSTPRS